MVLINFDFFKVCKWLLYVSLKAIFNPIVFYPALVILFASETLAFLAGWQSDFISFVRDGLSFELPQSFSTYVYGNQNGIARAVLYATALDWVLNILFTFPRLVFDIVYALLSGAFIYFSFVFVGRFKSIVVRFLKGIVPS